MEYTNKIHLGSPNEWENFKGRHPKIIEKIRSLHETLEKIFLRGMEEPTQADTLIFFLGRLAVEDFMEILLLCGNGYGFGAMKLLRGLYERSVNLKYIAKHPDKTQDFLDYHHIHVGRHFNHASRILDMKKHISEEQIGEIKQNYNKVKGKYTRIICKKCGKTELMYSWSDLDILSMAREVELDALYLKCYYEPTLQMHSTTFAITSRLILKDDNIFTFDSEADPTIVDHALIGAHNLIINIVFTVNEYFKLGLDVEIQERFADFMQIWESREGRAEENNSPTIL